MGNCYSSTNNFTKPSLFTKKITNNSSMNGNGSKEYNPFIGK